MMGTRCGALDPGALLYLMEVEGLDVHEAGHMLYHESGLLGVSGQSADPRALLAREAEDPRCAAALALFVRRVVREIGALVAVLGGLDLLVFTAGIGEHQAEVRRRIAAELGFLHLRLDEAANAANAAVISAAGSAVQVAVEPTNEEWVAARHARGLLRA
jgi:acetate kinase